MNEEKHNDSLVPSMNVSLPAQQTDEPNLIEDDVLLGIYGEIVDNIRTDRKEIDSILNNFVNMVINEGDATAASKEALVNLIKIKSDAADKMAKIADLMTRIKLKEKDTFPRYLAAKQENTINISGGSKRELLKRIEKMQKLKKQKEEPEK